MIAKRIVLALGLLLFASLYANSAVRFVRGYWHFNSKLVPVATIDANGFYWDGTRALDVDIAIARAGTGRDALMWTMYLVMAGALIWLRHVWRQSMRQIEEQARWMARSQQIIADVKAGKPGAIDEAHLMMKYFDDRLRELKKGGRRCGC